MIKRPARVAIAIRAGWLLLGGAEAAIIQRPQVSRFAW